MSHPERCPIPTGTGQRPGPGRRSLIASGLLGSVGAALAGCTDGAGRSAAGGAVPATSPTTSGVDPRARLTRPFAGPRQAGVDDPAQSFATWVGMDLSDDADADTVRRLMRVWTDDIARLTQGRPGLTDLEPELAQMSADLTVTLGWGPRVFDVIDRPQARPAWLAPLPAFDEIDDLDPAWDGTDLVLQICAESPTTLAHTRRQLVSAAGDLAQVRWLQQGFREPMLHGHQFRMRNLFGQVDGTVQPDIASDPTLVWSDGTDGWLPGGTSMVIRRIAMDLVGWERVDRASRENAIGRTLGDGGPVTGGGELDPPDLEAVDALGFPVIDDFAHLRRAIPRAPIERILRRPYSYADPAADGSTRSGLVFVAFQADPVRQFVPIQRRLAQADLLNLWTTPVGSSVYAVLPGIAGQDYLGQDLLPA